MAKKKKKTLGLWLLLIALVILVGCYLILLRHNDLKNASDVKEDTITLTAKDETQIVKIEVKNELGGFTLTKEDKVWKNLDEPSIPVDGIKVDGMLHTVSNMEATRIVAEETEDLATYGLDKPVVSLLVTFNDNSTVGFDIGASVPTGNEYYAMMVGDRKVYTISSNLYDAYSLSVDSLAEVEKVPTINADNITGLTVSSEDSKEFSITYDEKASNSYYPWSLTKPYLKPLLGDSAKISTLLKNYTSLSYDKTVEYNCKDLSKYGLDKPYASVTITYFEEKEAEDQTQDTNSDSSNSDTTKTEKTYHNFTLLIGSVNEEGSYYVKAADATSVNLMPEDTVKKLLTINAFDYVDKAISQIDITSLEGFTITAADAVYNFRIEAKKDTYSYYLGNKKLDEAKFKEFYQKLISVTADAQITNEVTDDTSAMKVVFHNNTGALDTTVEYLLYDESFYRAKVDGVENFLVLKRSVDDLVAMIKEF